jgi:predicted DNA-binding transcriptional regulator YafY
VIKFDPSLERYLKENIWHPSQVFKKDQDGSVVLTMEVGGLVEVMSWVLGFGGQAEVIEPEHLRQAVTEELAATSGKYLGEPFQPLLEEAEESPW